MQNVNLMLVVGLMGHLSRSAPLYLCKVSRAANRQISHAKSNKILVQQSEILIHF